MTSIMDIIYIDLFCDESKDYYPKIIEIYATKKEDVYHEYCFSYKRINVKNLKFKNDILEIQQSFFRKKTIEILKDEKIILIELVLWLGIQFNLLFYSVKSYNIFINRLDYYDIKICNHNLILINNIITKKLYENLNLEDALKRYKIKYTKLYKLKHKVLNIKKLSRELALRYDFSL